MPTCLVTGCGGFIGSHLAELLITYGCRVVGTVHRETRHITHLAGSVEIQECDVTDRARVTALVREANPDFVFHLAAQDLIETSWEDPEGTFRVNVLGTLFLLEAIRDSGLRPVVQIAGSSAEYGPSGPEDLPIPEGRELHPRSPYGLSKVTATHLGYLYAMRYGLRVHCVRPFQFIGPRKGNDACSDFARGILKIERGWSDELRVGNLEVVRDLLDVRDGVKAMWLVAQIGQAGEAYNICAGVGYKLRDILDRLIGLAGISVKIREDRSRFRPLDESAIVGGNGKLRGLGWQAVVPLDETLARVLDYWRRALDQHQPAIRTDV